MIWIAVSITLWNFTMILQETSYNEEEADKKPVPKERPAFPFLKRKNTRGIWFWTEKEETREDNENWDKIYIQQQFTIKRINIDSANGDISGTTEYEGKAFGKYYHTTIIHSGHITGVRKQ